MTPTLRTRVRQHGANRTLRTEPAVTPRAARRAGEPVATGGHSRKSSAVSLLGVTMVAAALGANACDWQTPTTGPHTIHTTSVEMQDQHGESLGSKTLASFETTNTLTRADVGNVPNLSSKYIAVRFLPSGGTIGGRVASTVSGSVRFSGSPDGRPLRAVFMSTADVPESVMDCFFKSGFGQRSYFTRTWTVGRILPGMPDPAPGVTILNGDESILINAINDINAALVDRQGVALGRLSWEPDNEWADIMAGFASKPIPFDPYDPFGYSPYVLIDPTAARGTQMTTALGGFLEIWGQFTNPCGKSTGSYLADPALDYRLSKQGVSIIRFGAYLAW